jgi:hypothetical protein
MIFVQYFTLQTFHFLKKWHRLPAKIYFETSNLCLSRNREMKKGIWQEI